VSWGKQLFYFYNTFDLVYFKFGVEYRSEEEQHSQKFHSISKDYTQFKAQI